MSTGDLFKLYVKVKYFNFKNQCNVICRYYKNIRFAFIDISLLIFYFFINPYRASKSFLRRNNYSNIHIYGETPLNTFEKIYS